MISSGQVAAMHAQQGQAFSAQQQYSQQLSAQMPQAYGGSFGPGGGFSYSGQSPGMQSGASTFGNNMTAGLGGAARAAFSPMSMGMTGAMAGYGLGGVRGAMMGGGIGMAVGAASNHVFGNMMTGAQESAATERTMSQFQFTNANAQGGKGFSRADTQQVGAMVRQMGHMPELLSSFGELNRIMDKMGQMGMMQGVRDASAFQTKFKETIKTLKDMSKIVGGTMEDALQQMGEARKSGIYSNAGQVANSMQRRVVAGVTGMDQNQIGAVQMYGADVNHAMGGSRKYGAQNATRMAGTLGMMNQMGTLTNDQIMEFSGQEGAAGIQAMTGQMTDLAHKMSRGNVGRAMSLALGKTVDGRFTGEMDEELVSKVRSGEMGLHELKRLARSKIQSRGAKLSYKSHENALRANTASAVGAEGIGMQLQSILGSRGWNNPDATNLVMRRFGASEREAHMLQQMMPNLQATQSGLQDATKTEGMNSVRNSMMKESYGLDAIKHRVKRKIQSKLGVDYFKEVGANVRDSFAEMADKFVDDISGSYRLILTKELAETVGKAQRGDSAAKLDLQNRSKRSESLFSSSNIQGNIAGYTGGVNLDWGAQGGFGGAASKLLNNVLGNQSSGEKIEEKLGRLDGGKYLTKNREGLLGLKDRAGGVYGDDIQLTNGSRLSRENLKLAEARFNRYAEGEGGKEDYEKLLGRMGEKDTGTFVKAFDHSRTTASFMEAEKSGDTDKMENASKREMHKYLKRTGQEYLLDKALNRDVEIGSMRERSDRRHKNLGNSKASYEGPAEDVSSMSGAQYKGRKGFANVLGMGALAGVGAMSGQGASKMIRDIDNEMSKKMPGSDLSLSWSEVRKSVEEGGLASKLLMGNGSGDGSSGLLNPNAASTEQIRGMLSSKDPLSAEDKAVLEKAGHGPGVIDEIDKLKREGDSGRDKLKKILGAVDSGRLGLGTIVNMAQALDASGMSKLRDMYGKDAGGLRGRLDKDKGDTSIERLTANSKTSGIIDDLTARAASLQSIADGANPGSFTDNSYEIARKIAGTKGKDQSDTLRVADGGVRAAYYADKQARGKFGDKGQKLRGMDAAGILKKYGVTEDDNPQYRGQIKELEDLMGGSKMVGKGQEEGILKYMASEKGSGALNPSGTDSRSTQVSEADVAKAFTTMNENAAQTATILTSIATAMGAKIEEKNMSEPGK